MSKYLKKYTKLIEEIKIAKDSQTLKELQEKANNILDKHINMINQKGFISEIKNNSNNYSFGDIKMMFESIAPLLFTSSEGRNIIKKYTKTIKEDKTLLNLFLIQENIIQPKNINNISSFITESFGLIGDIKRKKLRESILKLIDVLCEGLNIVNINTATLTFDDKTKEINENIDYLVTNTKTLKNIVEYTNKLNNITTFIESHKIEDVENVNNLDIDTLAMQMVENFNEKYSDELTLNESDIIKTIISSNDKENIFETHKNECLNILETVIDTTNDDELKNRLNTIKEKINIKEFNEQTVNNDIINFIELKETLNQE